MSLSHAQNILRDGVRELVVLRAETREWICTKCRVVYPTPIELCPDCGSMLRPAAAIQQAAFLSQIEKNQQRIRELEQTVLTLLEFIGSAEESSTT